MVSLVNDRASGGGYFFDADVQQPIDDTDEASLISSVLVTEDEQHFRTIPISGAILVEIILMIALFSCAFAVPQMSTPDSCFILYCFHAGVWTVVLIICFYLHYEHYLLQRFGYLEFHRKTKMLKKLPLCATSCGNTVLLILSALFEKYCPGLHICPANSPMDCQYYIQILISIEILVVVPCLIKYLVLVVQFNQSKTGPDVNQDELLVSYMQSHAPMNEIGFRDEDYMEEIMEKQADMIRYLKQHNIYLSGKILKLTSQLNALQGSVNRY